MPTATQVATAVLYRDAAAQRIAAAHSLYQLGVWVEANYLAGLAVECILRGYRVMIDPRFDSRHDINKLYDLAKFSDVVPIHDTKNIAAALGTVVSLWSNDHRFIPESEMKKRWLRRKLNKRGRKWIKGDFLKERIRELINSADQIVSTGVARWETLNNG